MLVTEGRMHVHELLRMEGEQRGQLHGRTQGLHQRGPDRQNLVVNRTANRIANRIVNDAVVLLLQTRLMETLSDREIGGVGCVGALREIQGNPVQKTESLNQHNVILGGALDTARCESQTGSAQAG